MPLPSEVDPRVVTSVAGCVVPVVRRKLGSSVSSLKSIGFEDKGVDAVVKSTASKVVSVPLPSVGEPSVITSKVGCGLPVDSSVTEISGTAPVSFC